MGQLSATMHVIELKISVKQHNIWFKKKKSDVMKPYIIRLHLKNLERPRDHKLPKAQEKLCAAPWSSHQN